MPTFTMLRAIFAILSQTLTKVHDAVSALTRFLEFKPDHMFGCILYRQACTPTFVTFQAILTHPLNPTLLKPHDGVSLSSSFLEFKFDHKFGCEFDQQRACKLLRHSKIFSPPLSANLAKPHNEVSRLTNFSK